MAYIKGLQGDGKYLKVAACAKHYAVHSGPEAIRHEFDAEVSQKDLWETYLPAFEAAVKEGEVEAVMGAYNRTLGEPCCGSDLLIRKFCAASGAFRDTLSPTAGRFPIFTCTTTSRPPRRNPLRSPLRWAVT